MCKIWGVEKGNAQKFQFCGLIIDHLVLGIIDDARRFDLPDWRFVWIIATWLTSCVNTLIKDSDVIVFAFCAFSCKTGIFGCFYPKRANKTRAKVIGNVNVICCNNIAVRFRDLDAALSDEAGGCLIIGYLVSLQGILTIIDLNIANSRDTLPIIVIDHLISFDQHAGIWVCLELHRICQ